MKVEERIYREIVKETGISLDIVRRVVRNQFLLTGEYIKGEDYPEVFLQYLGKFYPLENRLEKFNKVRKDECNK